MLHGVGWSGATLAVGVVVLAIVSLGVSGPAAALEDVTTVAGGLGTGSAAKQLKVPTDTRW